MTKKTDFSSEQYGFGYPDGIEFHWWHIARNRILANIIKKQAGAGAAVLDIGCGRGVTVNGLRQLGIRCKGIDTSHPRPVPGMEPHIYRGIKVRQLPGKERVKYNTITFLDVIEHISDPIFFINDISGMLPNLENIIITVPAHKELWSNYDDFYGHLRRYSLDMLKELGEKLNGDIRANAYFFHLLYPFLWYVVHFKKKRDPQITPPRGFMKRVHKILSNLFVLDYYIFPAGLPGSSAILSISLK